MKSSKKRIKLQGSASRPKSIKETKQRIAKVNPQLTQLSQERTELNRKIQIAKLKWIDLENEKMRQMIKIISETMQGWKEIKSNLLAHLKTSFPQEIK